MFKLLKTLFRVDKRPEWVKEKDREFIKTLKESGDDLYVSPSGGIHRNLKSVKRGGW